MTEAKEKLAQLLINKPWAHGMSESLTQSGAWQLNIHIRSWDKTNEAERNEVPYEIDGIQIHFRVVDENKWINAKLNA